jgi:two-component system response regulator
MDETEILLVEDNPTDAELILRAFKKLTHDTRLEIVNDGASALEILSGLSESISKKTKHGPRVILLDLNMPKVDGLQILRSIKSDEFARTIPVVILTSSTNEEDIKECYQSGANSYIVKPLNYEDFFQTVSEIIHYWLDLNHLP